MVLELPWVLCVCAAALTRSAWSKSSWQSLVLGLLLLPGELYLPHLGETAAGTAVWIGRMKWMMLWCISRKRCCFPVVAASFSAAYLTVWGAFGWYVVTKLWSIYYRSGLRISWSPVELWCAELQTSCAGGRGCALDGLCEAACAPVCQSCFLLSDVRSGTGCREVHVACPDGRVWWKRLLSGNICLCGMDSSELSPFLMMVWRGLAAVWPRCVGRVFGLLPASPLPRILTLLLPPFFLPLCLPWFTPGSEPVWYCVNERILRWEGGSRGAVFAAM